jgi:hypothetical protein
MRVLIESHGIGRGKTLEWLMIRGFYVIGGKFEGERGFELANNRPQLKPQ